MRIPIFLGLGCWFLVAAKLADDVKTEMAKLEGTWAMVSAEKEGRQLPEDIVKGSKRVAKDGVTTVTIDGQPYAKSKFTIDPTKKPKTIDYTLLEGANKGRMQLGIYELDGDTVKFCFTSPGHDRPTDFTTKSGDWRTLSVWKKEKK